jgi:hypothetical protein
MEIKTHPEEPFSDVLNEMNIISQYDREEFFTAILFFTNECEKMAKLQDVGIGGEISAYFNWRAIETDKYFKVFFTYYHSEELNVGVDDFEEISKEEYVDTYGDDILNDDCGCNGE